VRHQGARDIPTRLAPRWDSYPIPTTPYILKRKEKNIYKEGGLGRYLQKIKKKGNNKNRKLRESGN